MLKTIVVMALMVACLSACQNSAADKVSSLPALNVNDLNDQHKKDKEALRAKYDGKEVVVMGRAVEDFNPNHIYFETGDKQLSFSLQADMSKESWVGVDCHVDAAHKDKFAGIKKDDVFAVKGVLHVKQGNMELEPCNREFRGEK